MRKRSSNSRVFWRRTAAIRTASRRSVRTCRRRTWRDARALDNAQVTFDRFHVKQKLSEAIDTVRRAEAKQHKELLKNTRYLWLKRPDNLTEKQLDWLDELLQQPLETVRAYEQALKFDDFYELEDPAGAEEYLAAGSAKPRPASWNRWWRLPRCSRRTGRESSAGTKAACPTGCWRA